MKTVMFSCRVPADFIDAVKALQVKHGMNSQGEVLVAAIACFSDSPVKEVMPLNDRVAVLESQVLELQSALTALTARVANKAKTKITAPFEPVPSDRQDLLEWANRQLANNHQIKSIKEAFNQAYNNPIAPGVNDEVRVIKQIAKFAESIVGSDAGDDTGNQSQPKLLSGNDGD